MSQSAKTPSLPPPVKDRGIVAAIRKNFFSSWFDTLVTIVFAYLLYITIPPLLEWMTVKATFLGSTREDCSPDGACWVFISARFYQFIYGFYPDDQVWRVNIVYGYLFALIALMTLPPFPKKHKIAFWGWIILPFLAVILLSGGYFGLPAVETHKWGGLLVTLVISTVGIVASLPLGVLFALGRRSELPIIKTASIIFIEFWRGIPLITVLFMASVMLPLFLSEGVNFDKLLRCLIGVALFQAAYMAEIVRGGLQAIPKGQYEAADSLGLSYPQAMGLIVLPQALKKVIPGIVNSFIALFKDTTLVLIVGIFDLLGIIQAALHHPDWLGYSIEGYLFAAAVFWVFCYAMSYYSQKLEKSLKTSH